MPFFFLCSLSFVSDIEYKIYLLSYYLTGLYKKLLIVVTLSFR